MAVSGRDRARTQQMKTRSEKNKNKADAKRAGCKTGIGASNVADLAPKSLVRCEIDFLKLFLCFCVFTSERHLYHPLLVYCINPGAFTPKRHN